jgi:hypothetical protein
MPQLITTRKSFSTATVPYSLSRANSTVHESADHRVARSRITFVYTASKVTRQTPAVSWDITPFTIPLQGELVRGWQIKKPFDVIVEVDEQGYFVVSDDIFGVYGEGRTQRAALDDYAVSLCEYFELVAAEAAQDEANQALLAHLQIYLEPTRPC